MPERPPLVYLDSCVYLDLITRNKTPHSSTGEERWRVASSLFQGIDNGEIALAASALIEAEVLCNGETRQRRRNSEQVDTMVRGWFDAPSTRWSDVDRFLVRDALTLVGQYGAMAGGDATHLAAAVRLECDYLFTHDQRYPHGRTIRQVLVTTPTPVGQGALFNVRSATDPQA